MPLQRLDDSGPVNDRFRLCQFRVAPVPVDHKHVTTISVFALPFNHLDAKSSAPPGLPDVTMAPHALLSNHF
jgi:hypothetical protein